MEKEKIPPHLQEKYTKGNLPRKRQEQNHGQPSYATPHSDNIRQPSYNSPLQKMRTEGVVAQVLDGTLSDTKLSKPLVQAALDEILWRNNATLDDAVQKLHRQTSCTRPLIVAGEVTYEPDNPCINDALKTMLKLHRVLDQQVGVTAHFHMAPEDTNALAVILERIDRLQQRKDDGLIEVEAIEATTTESGG